jgi:hypothetical protein
MISCRQGFIYQHDFCFNPTPNQDNDKAGAPTAAIRPACIQDIKHGKST